MTGEAIAFYSLAAAILVLAVMVITARSPVHSVLFLVLNFLCLAALYVVMQAPFLAVIQVLVYAGGIVVLYLFVVMLVSLKAKPEAHQDRNRQTWLGAGLAAAVLVELTAIVIWSAIAPLAGRAVSPIGTVEHIGMTLYADYLIPFEVASVLLLVAMVGAIVLAKREL